MFKLRLVVQLRLAGKYLYEKTIHILVILFLPAVQ